MKKFVKVLIVGILLTLTLCMAGCESFSRDMKSFGSDVGGGLSRTVTVYSYDGKQIAQYSGKFDIETNDYGTKVLFDKDGKRTIIYNAVVIAQEN